MSHEARHFYSFVRKVTIVLSLKSKTPDCRGKVVHASAPPPPVMDLHLAAFESSLTLTPRRSPLSACGWPLLIIRRGVAGMSSTPTHNQNNMPPAFPCIPTRCAHMALAASAIVNSRRRRPCRRLTRSTTWAERAWRAVCWDPYLKACCVVVAGLFAPASSLL